MTVSASPAQRDQLFARGMQALARGDIGSAGQVCRALISGAPRWPQAHFLVGLVASESSDWATARQAMKSAVSLDPSMSAAWAGLARAFAMSGQFANADVALSKAKALDPDAPMVCDLMGTVYTLLGDVKTALAWQKRASEKAQSAGVFALSRARSHTFLGETDAARAALLEAKEHNPLSGQVWWMLARLETQVDDHLIGPMRGAMAHASEAELPFFHYGIGKIFEDLAAWNEAFAAYEAGAWARRRQVHYDEAADETLFRALEETLTPDWFEGAGDGHAGLNAIFVTGQPRTGTTLVERILTAHSEIASAGELQQFPMALSRLGAPHATGRVNADGIRGAVRVAPVEIGRLYDHTSRSVRGELSAFVDKLPLNALYLPLIAASLPDAALIHLVRGAMDSCFASYKQLFADAYLHSYDQTEMARHHVRYRRLMDRWRDLLGPRMLDVPYEALVSDVPGFARQMADHAGLAYQPEMAAFYKSGGAVTTASAAQVRQKAHTGSVNRWRQFEKHLSPMMDVLDRAGIAF